MKSIRKFKESKSKLLY